MSMTEKTRRVELLLNPFCMADRDSEVIIELCNKLNVEVAVYNTWQITDARVLALPGHLQSFITDIRRGLKPGSVYSHLFVNGECLHLDGMTDFLQKAEQLIEAMMSE